MTGKELKQILQRSGLRMNVLAERMGIVPQSLNSIFNSEDMISQALGHAARNSTTAVYIQRDTKKVDEANRRVIDWVLYGKR